MRNVAEYRKACGFLSVQEMLENLVRIIFF